MERTDGFSLLELLIYMALLAIILPVVAVIFLGVNTGRVRNEVRAEVNSNLRFAVEKIESDLRSATAITTPAATGGTIAKVQDTGIDCTNASSSACFKAFSSNITTGDFLVYLGTSGTGGAGGTPATIATTTDSMGNSWTCRPQNNFQSETISNGSFGSGHIGIRICYAVATSTGPDTVTQSLSGGSTDGGFALVEFSGINTTSPFDTEATGESTSTVTSTVAMTTGAYSTAQASEVAVALAVSDSSCNTWSAGTGFTALTNFAACQSITPRAEYQIYSSIQSSAHATTAPYTLAATSTYSAELAIDAGSFKAATGGGATSTLSMSTPSGTITYCIISGVLRRQAGGGSCTASSDAITDTTVLVTTSTFTRLENTNSISGKTVVSIQADVAMSYNGTGPDEQYSQENITTVALRN